MKLKIFTLLLCSIFAVSAVAQKPEAYVKKLVEGMDVPVLDGEIDAVWDVADEYPIDLNFQSETPTIGNSSWKMLWTDRDDHAEGEAGIYVLIVVDDDNYWPNYLSAGANTWEYDKLEIYFDCNGTNLEDGGGAGTDGTGNGTGHYQFAPEFAEGKIDGSKQDGLESGDTDPCFYSHLVNNPDYVAEYFIALSVLINGDGVQVILDDKVGFDITVIDQDEGITTARQRAIWSNTGTVGCANESWNCMDECGILSFEGAEPPIYLEGLSIAGGTVIDENNGTLQLEAVIDPPEATEGYRWSVENGTGRATVDKNGLVTAVIDGTVSVMVTSEYFGDTVEVEISNQLVSLGEVNLIRNGFFKDVDDNNFPDEWGGGTSADGNCYVDDYGVSVHDPVLGGTAPWSYGFNQQNFGANNTDTYTFSFVAWAESPRNIMVGFEDPSNNYNRYGTSTSEWALTPSDYWWQSGPGTDPPQVWTGNSMWSMDLTTEPVKYEMDVVFDGKDPVAGSPTLETLQFHLGLSDTIVYLDSVILINDENLALIDDYIEVESIEITAEGGATSVELGGTLQLSAAVLPEDAELTDVNWRVEPDDGWATISEAGLLTGDSSGLVMVYASAKDDSDVEEMMTIRVKWPVGISDYSVTPLKVYPNPAVDELTVELGKENAMVSIFNSLGQKMDEVLVSGTEYRFDISRYASGIYYVKTSNSVVKFIK